MRKPDTIMIKPVPAKAGSRAYSWRAIHELRRQQIEAWEKTRPVQLTLFEMKDDRRPKCEGSTAGRYREPTLLMWMGDADS